MGGQHRALVVTADPSTLRSIRRSLERQGLRILHAENATDLLPMVEQHKPELVILDRQLRKVDGLDLCRNIRQRSTVPIIMLIDAEQTDEHVPALNAGADDYLRKPFTEQELIAHVAAVLRRAAWREHPNGSVFRSGKLEIDFNDRRLVRDGALVRLSRTEWSVLEELARHTGQVVAYRTLLHRVWGEGYHDEIEYLRVYIGRLRSKLEDDPNTPQYLLTAPGIGYSLALLTPPKESTNGQSVTQPSMVPPPSSPTNLPAPVTSFIGREHEIGATSTLLQRADVRLVTLTGVGGSGKTRLAIEIGTALRHALSDGVFWVELAPIREPSTVIATIAQVLGVKEATEQTLEENLKSYLRTKQLLLVLDNFEQVLEAGPTVAQLLASAAGLKILVTSREVLHLSGEHEFPVPPLALPDLAAPSDVQVLGQSSAVALFAARAQAIKRDFVLTNENAAAVAEMCVRLDGLPLAIELAAARIKLFPPDVLLARLGQRLKILTHGARDLPPRHQSLRALIDWSYELLNEDEQKLFRRLGVFVGGCTLAAAEAVGNAAADLQLDVLDGLQSLLDKNLLYQEAGVNGEPRFMMLETLREYALEQLARLGEEATVRQQQCTYYIAFTEPVDAELKGSQQELSLARLDSEHNNLRGVINHSLEIKDTKSAMQISGSLLRFWFMRGYITEGRDYFEKAVAQNKSQPDSVVPGIILARVLNGSGILAHMRGDFLKARYWYEQALCVQQEIGNMRGTADALGNLGVLAVAQHDYSQAKVYYEQCLTLFMELHDNWGIANTLSNLGIIYREHGDYLQAERLYNESLALKEALNDKFGIAATLDNLGLLATAQGDYNRAIHLHNESLSLRQELGDQSGISNTLANSSLALVRQGSYVEATRRLKESLVLQRQLQEQARLAFILEVVAALAAAQHMPVRAAKLFSIAAQIRKDINSPVAPDEQGWVEQNIALARAQLTSEAFASAWVVGQTMTVDEVINYALSDAAV